MAEIRINTTGGVKLYDADDSHYAQIVAGTITSNTDVMTLGHAAVVMGTKLDMNGSNLVLDADADTYLDTGTDDTIKFYVSGAHDLTIGANAINVLSGTTLTIDSGATITNSGTANGFSSADPSSADGDSLGTASAEWSDLYLADCSVIYFGNDQDTTLTHTDGTGLTLNSTNKLTFGDAASFIQQSSDGVLRIDGEATVDINASAAITLAATNVPVTVGGIPFYYGDTGSIYTHNVSGTDDSAQYNTSYGLTALDAITTGDSNTAVGHSAGGDLTTAYNNTFMGRGAGGSTTTGGTNTFIGFEAGHSNTTGFRNTVVGDIAYDDGFTSEGDNTAVGYQTMGGSAVGNGAEFNTAMGSYALDAITTADNTVAIGYAAGTALTTGADNTFVGTSAGTAQTTGANCVFIGKNAGSVNTTGARNVAIGHGAYANADTEVDNIAIGHNTLAPGAVAGGEYNLAIGSYSLDALTSADNNVSIGYSAGTAVTTGGDNVIIGAPAGNALTTGYSNTFVGKNCGNAMTTGHSSTLVGMGVTLGGNDYTNAIGLGHNFSVSSNDFSFGKASNVVTNDFDADANWSRSSDVRKKREIYDQELGLDFINDLRTVRFQWKPSNEFPKEWNDYSEKNTMDTDVIMHGFIAQEVKESLDKHASDNDKEFSGWKENSDGMQNTSREMFVIPLIKAVQELSAKVTALENA